MGIELLAAAGFGGAVIYFSGRRPDHSGLRRESFIASAAALFLAGLVLRLVLGYSSDGFSTDIDTFKAWGQMTHSVGLQNLYSQDAFLDYPPGYLYVLYLLEACRKALRLPFNSTTYTMIVKLPSIITDLCCAGVLLWIGRRKLGEKGALFLSAAYLFCPAVLVNSAQWGQMDSFSTAILFLSVLLLYRESYCPSALLYGLSIACKPQALIFAPVYLFFTIRKRKWGQLALGIACAFGMILVTAIPFTKDWNFLWLLERYKATMDYYDYYSINAYNFWGLVGYNWKGLPQGFSHTLLTFAAPLAATGLCAGLMLCSKRKDALFAAPILLMGVMYLFGVKMHERYLYPVFLFLLLCFLFTPDKRLPRAFAALVAANYANVTYVLYLFREKGGSYDPNEPLVRWLSTVQVLALCYALYVVWSVYVLNTVKEAPLRSSREWSRPAEVSFRFTRADWIVMAAITLVYGALAFWNLGGRDMALTPWAPSAGESATLYAEAPCDTLIYLPGLTSSSTWQGPRVGANFRVETSRDGVHWSVDGNLNDGSRGNYVYTWTRYILQTPSPYVRLVAEDDYSVLNEAALKLENQLAIAKAAAWGPGAETLTDEQEIVPLFTTYENSAYFDEIYHARTAYENILGLEPYENTHPPLGKYIISLGIRLFGMNPFGWRFMGVLFGILMLPALYYLLKQLFGKTALCCCGTLWFAFDFMHYTQTRITTIDTYAVFFLLLMYGAMVNFLRRDLLKESVPRLLVPLGLCGLFMGLGIASKWTAAYGAVGLALLYFGKLALSLHDAKKEKKKLPLLWKRCLVLCLWCCLFFLVIPFLVYYAAYLPLTTLPHNRYDVWGRFWSYQTTMFNYHSQLKDTHFFASPWYEWPLVIRPIWYFSGDPANQLGQYSTIAALGNPLFWWAGLPALGAAVLLWAKERRTWAAVVLCGFAAVYVPWMLVPRITFIYHYFTATPFLAIALTGVFDRFSETKLGSRTLSVKKLSCSVSVLAMAVFTAVCLILFWVFFPLLSGKPTDHSYINGLKLFDTWYF